MALIPVVKSNRDGIDPGFTAASASDTFDNTNKPVVHIRTAATPTTPTFAFGDDVDTVVVAGRAGDACPANSERVYGPFPDFPYSDSGRLVTITYSSTTDVEVAVVQYGDLLLENTP